MSWLCGALRSRQNVLFDLHDVAVFLSPIPVTMPVFLGPLVKQVVYCSQRRLANELPLSLVKHSHQAIHKITFVFVGHIHRITTRHVLSYEITGQSPGSSEWSPPLERVREVAVQQSDACSQVRFPFACASEASLGCLYHVRVLGICRFLTYFVDFLVVLLSQILSVLETIRKRLENLRSFRLVPFVRDIRIKLASQQPVLFSMSFEPLAPVSSALTRSIGADAKAVEEEQAKGDEDYWVVREGAGTKRKIGSPMRNAT